MATPPAPDVEGASSPVPGARVVSTLLCHRDMATALSCFASLGRAYPEVTLRIHDDGSLTGEDLALLRGGAFGIDSIVGRDESDPRMDELLAGHPHCAALRKRQAYALKLFDIPVFAGPDLAYVDSDVYFLRHAPGLFDCPPGAGSIFMQDVHSCYALYPWHAAALGVRLPPKVNSGLFVTREPRLDLDLVEHWLSKGYAEYTKLPWLEQTLWAMLYGGARMRQWDPARVGLVTPDLDLTDPALVALHFVSPVRARLAELERPGARTADAAVVPVVSDLPAPPLGVVGQSAELLRRRLSRVLRR